jgi:hypothetical protein
MHGVGAEIDPHAERVFHQSEVFIASPKQRLKIGRDLQSDLQRFLWPPMRRCEVEVNCRWMRSIATAPISPAASVSPAVRKILPKKSKGWQFKIKQPA